MDKVDRSELGTGLMEMGVLILLFAGVMSFALWMTGSNTNRIEAHVEELISDPDREVEATELTPSHLAMIGVEAEKAAAFFSPDGQGEWGNIGLLCLRSKDGVVSAKRLSRGEEKLMSSSKAAKKLSVVEMDLNRELEQKAEEFCKVRLSA
jgi:hypothetical protein